MEPLQFTPETLRELVGTSELPVLVDFWAPWCGSCRLFAPTVRRIVADHVNRMAVGTLDVDAFLDVAQEFDVQSVPTLLLFVDGIPVHRFSGPLSKASLEAELRPYLIPVPDINQPINQQ
jgi:thioredoxin